MGLSQAHLRNLGTFIFNMKLIFASNNLNKIKEIRSLAGNMLEIQTMYEAGFDLEINEPHETLEENAAEKSKTIYKITRENCFSEDSGLEVEILNGQPGVKSARYAGKEKSTDKNIEKLLGELKNETNRKACFRTVISLIINGKENKFEGITEGMIMLEKRGNNGFGYDPVFLPNGSDKTFGEMELEEKNKYSHRRKALEKMLAFLTTSCFINENEQLNF